MAETGLSLRVNPLFLLILILFILTGMFMEVVVAFILVFMHELVHLIAAYRAGYSIRRIEIFPFGGVAEYSGLIEMAPWQEIKIALAGPLFNLILAGFFILVEHKLGASALTSLIIKYNLLIGGFNLLPALPMDGGRVLRAILVNKLGFQKGTLWAVKFAKKMAVIGVIAASIALVYNLANVMVLFVGFFVYGAALKEEKQIVYRLLNYLTHREEIIRDFKVKPALNQVVRGELSVGEVVYFINPTRYNLFYVLDPEMRLAGILTETRLVNSFFRMKDKEIKVIDLV